MNKHQHALDFILSLAIDARAISLGSYARGAAQQVKADRTLVTEADKKIEDMIREKTLALGWGIIGEEAGSANDTAEYVVITDPIDGTNHFITRDDNFFTLIGVYHQQDGFIAGVCDQPASRHLWTGLKGAGAFHHVKDTDGNVTQSEKMAGSAVANIGDALLANWNPLALTGADKYFFEDLAAQSRAFIAGGDGGNYARIAAGQLNIAFEGLGGLYDIAAFLPMLAETGCAIKKAQSDGFADITLADRDKFTCLAASNAALFEAVAILKKQNAGHYDMLDKTMQKAMNSR